MDRYGEYQILRGTWFAGKEDQYATHGTPWCVVFPIPGNGVQLRLHSVCVRFNTERPKNVSEFKSSQNKI